MKNILFAALILTAVLAAAAEAPKIKNAQLENRSAKAGLASAIASLAKEGSQPKWFGYEVKTRVSDRQLCCFDSLTEASSGCCGGCRLEGGRGNFNTKDSSCSGRLEADTFFVLARLENGQVQKIRSYSTDCELDAGGVPVVWFADVVAAESVGWLKSEALRGEGRSHEESALHAIAMHVAPEADQVLNEFFAPGQPERRRKKAAFWIGMERGRPGFEMLRKLAKDDASPSFREHLTFVLSQSHEPEAINEVIRIAHDDTSSKVRGQALFWLAQKAGRKAAQTISDAMENDPDIQVKKKAVFALSNLPKDEGVPLLIKVAKTHQSRVVRKEAIFWLGQSGDERALKFLEDFITEKTDTQ